MSKVICDVCGTTFPETAAQCPICGCARNGSAQTAAGDSGAQAEAYSYVRGGRFSKSNVKKRNKTGQPMQRRSPESPKKNEDGGSSNKGLVIVVVILLVAIIAVCAYIGIRFFMPELKPNETEAPKQTTTVTPEPTESQTQPTDGTPCTKIMLSSTIIEFTDTERSQLLSVVVTPMDTTDELVFTSADPLVATVTEGGLVTPVASGETVITVTCGEITEECRIVCSFGDSTEPFQPDEPDMDAGTFQFTFNLKPDFVINDGMTGDVTLDAGKKWKMYSSMNVDASMVIWSSDDENYATIEDGVVTAVAPTKTYVLVHAEYAGIKYTCRIRIKGTAGTTEATPTQPAPTQPAGPATGVTVTMNRTDFTLSGVGQTWNVYKGTPISQSVAPTDIVWTSENPQVVTVEDGLVTATGSGYTYIHAEYNGQIATCKVFVK